MTNQTKAPQANTQQPKVDLAALRQIQPPAQTQAQPPTPKVAVTPNPTVPPKQFHVFHNTLASCKMTTDAGRTMSFVAGKFITDNKEETEYLQRELALNHPYLYVEAGKEVQTSDELDPMKVLKAKHFAEFQRQQKELAERIAAGQNLTGNTELQKLTPGSTADINSLAGDSSSGT